MLRLKQAIATLACLALALGIMVSAFGCGDSDNSRAQDLLQKADTFMNGLDKGVDKLSTDLDSLSEAIKQGSSLTAAFLDATASSLKTQAQQVVAEVQQASGEIKKVLALKGSDDYRKYAGLQDEVLNNAITLTRTLSDVFTQLSSVSAALASGTATDSTLLADTASGWIDSFNDIKSESRALLDKAARLKKEKGL